MHNNQGNTNQGDNFFNDQTQMGQAVPPNNPFWGNLPPSQIPFQQGTYPQQQAPFQEYPPPQAPFQQGNYPPPMAGQLQYQTVPSPQPPQKRNVFRWYKRQKRSAKIGIGCGTFLLALMLCMCSTVAYAGTHPVPLAKVPTATSAPATQIAFVATSQPTHQTTKPTPIPTLKPTNTPVPTTVPTQVQSTGQPLIGGGINPYIAKYGQQDSGRSHKDYYIFTYSDNSDYLTVTTSNGHAMAVLIDAPNHVSWSESEATAQCMALAPLDTVYKRQMTFTDSQGNLMDLQKVYYSASLSNQFPASEFTDENSNQTTPGTFGIVLSYDPNNTTKFLTCAIQVGLQQY